MVRSRRSRKKRWLLRYLEEHAAATIEEPGMVTASLQALGSLAGGQLAEYLERGPGGWEASSWRSARRPAPSGSLRFPGVWAMIAGVQQFISRGAVVATLLLLTFAVSAAAATTPITSGVIHTRWDIQALAMTGSVVAYDVSGRFSRRPPKGCANKIFAFDLSTRTTRRISGEKTCYSDGTPTGDGVRELAVAEKRFAWIVNQGGNTQSYDYLRTASLPRPKERKLGAAARFGEIGSLDGHWIGSLVGSGNLLAVNRWSTAVGTIGSSELDLVGPTGLRRLVTGPKALFAQAIDSGRIAVLRGDGTVGIYSGNGKLLLAVQPGSAREVALNGRDLVVLTKMRTIEVYDSRSGARRGTWAVSRQATTLDTYGGLAVYADHPADVIGRLQVHALYLATGKDVVVGTGTYEGRPRRDVELEAPGLVYTKNPHTLVFISRGRLLAAVS
jgi:hypothetical protein